MITVRRLFIALTALVFSASVAFAGQPIHHATPSAAAKGLGVAASHSERTVPTVKTEGTNEDTDSADTEKPDSNADNCTTDPTGLTTDQLNQLTHGSIVCWAAHQPTPDGYKNHGAWVSHWAKMDVGSGRGTHGASSKSKSQ